MPRKRERFQQKKHHEARLHDRMQLDRERIELDPFAVGDGFGVVFSLAQAVTTRAAEPNDGSVLPFPTPPSASKAGQTLQESVMKRRVEPNHLSADAPDILIILIDDAGFGVPDTFGGFAHTPTLIRPPCERTILDQGPVDSGKSVLYI
jgi:hypothetical protein